MSNEMTNQETTQLLHRFFDAWALRDVPAIASNLSESATLSPPRSLGRTVEGRDAVAQIFAGAGAAKFLDVQTIERTVDSLIVDGQNAAAVLTLRAELLAGGQYHNSYCWVFSCRDGVIQTAVEFTDSNHAVRTFTGKNKK